MNVISCILTLCISTVVLAQTGETAGVDASDVAVCEGLSNKDWLFSLSGTVLGTIVMAIVGMQTLSRGLAGSGYRQSAANLAGIGMGALVGGAAGAAIMAGRVCGAATAPGFVGMATAGLGLIVLIFALATGR